MTSMAYFPTSSSTSLCGEHIPVQQGAPVERLTQAVVAEYGSALPEIDALSVKLLRLAAAEGCDISDQEHLAAKVLCRVAKRVLQSDFDDILLSEAIQQMALPLIQGTLGLYRDQLDQLPFRVLARRSAIDASHPGARYQFLTTMTKELFGHFGIDIVSYNLATSLLSIMIITRALERISYEELQILRLELAQRLLDYAFFDRANSASETRVYSVLLKTLPSILNLYIAAEKKTFSLCNSSRS